VVEYFLKMKKEFESLNFTGQKKNRVVDNVLENLKWNNNCLVTKKGQRQKDTLLPSLSLWLMIEIQ